MVQIRGYAPTRLTCHMTPDGSAVVFTIPGGAAAAQKQPSTSRSGVRRRAARTRRRHDWHQLPRFAARREARVLSRGGEAPPAPVCRLRARLGAARAGHYPRLGGENQGWKRHAAACSAVPAGRHRIEARPRSPGRAPWSAHRDAPWPLHNVIDVPAGAQVVDELRRHQDERSERHGGDTAARPGVVQRAVCLVDAGFVSSVGLPWDASSAWRGRTHNGLAMVGEGGRGVAAQGGCHRDTTYHSLSLSMFFSLIIFA